MPHLPDELRRFVERRAAERCEYCHAPQLLVNSPFHIEHIMPSSRGGTTAADNLALGCNACNLAKGVRTVVPDPLGEEAVRLFHPRVDRWEAHFRWDDDRILLIGNSPIGRATVAALNMNSIRQTRARPYWRLLGLFP